MVTEEDVPGSGYNINFWNNFISDIRIEYPETKFIAEDASWNMIPPTELISSLFDGNFQSYSSIEGMQYFFSPVMYNLGYLYNYVNSFVQNFSQCNILNILDNHDLKRFSSIILDNDAFNKLGAVCLFTTPFPPVIYNGSELGMKGYKVDFYQSDANDYHIREPFEWEANLVIPPHAQWYADYPDMVENQFVQDNDGISVEEQENNPNSLLNFYRFMSEFRSEHDVFQTGDYDAIGDYDEPLSIFMRSDSDEEFIVILNQSYQTIEVDINFSDFFGYLQQSEVISLEDQLSSEQWEDITYLNINNYHKTFTPYATYILEIETQYAFVLDGLLDEDAELLVSGSDGNIWWKNVNGLIYLAANVNDSHDTFIFLSESVYEEIEAPWLKSGFVGNWNYFCGYEEDSIWSGWYEGYDQINNEQFGSYAGDFLEVFFNPAEITMNDSLYIAVGYYETSNNGSLISQIPDGNSNEDIEIDEYAVFNINNSTDTDDDHLNNIEENHVMNVSPNPFNPCTNISFSLNCEENVNIAIYNIKGQKVAQLLAETLNKGNHKIIWDAHTQASGIYFLRFQTPTVNQLQKLVLLK